MTSLIYLGALFWIYQGFLQYDPNLKKVNMLLSAITPSILANVRHDRNEDPTCGYSVAPSSLCRRMEAHFLPASREVMRRIRHACDHQQHREE